jgi:thiamine biosynthesis lipoprotein
VGQRIHAVEFIMGTAITVDVADAPDGVVPGDVTVPIFAWFTAVDERFSTYKADSEVSRLNRGEVRASDLSADMRHVLDVCESLRAETAGYFDAYATGRFDPSGYVKGWSVQVASDRLIAAGLPNHCVNAGGDIRVRGRASGGGPWRIGIRHPVEHMKVAWVVAGDDIAVATSGTYERGLHVIDPFRGAPADELSSVTVVGPDLGAADGYATAALAMGRRGLDWLATLPGHTCAVVTSDGEAYTSPGLPVLPADAPGADEPPIY